ncbi:phosphoribosylglycinamide formyltransferase [Arenimonas terrae]|jgi:phosphoribosylglycinamide formyltransferase-1|uniref:Phosphoribosylglycinamide formyltransferase n=1 Tax=Arenimonas terrae TaxID=2546226 RepID=A0A5C4RWP8_9GAMM|nr:phosphoribosylglycinamide formyltransferase [Arenimonas terrae]TNJ35395.1 phosphoribosylglycinamide formyltransferase [Arenimonas terrae]
MSGFRIAVLASGRGSNLQALIDAIGAGRLDARIAGVFSDKPDSGAIALARQHGLPAVARSPRDHASRAAHDEALFSEIEGVQPDLIVCAGYMRIIGEAALRRFEERMINIHPSLLPKYPGLDTHARVLAAGDPEHGASVHAVIPALDAGPLLAQTRLSVAAGDDAQSLSRRLLPREHALLVASVDLLARGRVRLRSDHVELDGRRLAAPLQLRDDNRLEEA